MLNSRVLDRSLHLTPLVFFLSFIVAGGVGIIATQSSDDVIGLLLVVVGISILAIYMIPHLAWMEAGSFLPQTLTTGLLLRLGFSMVSLWSSYALYGGLEDAGLYHHYGNVVAQHLWRLEFDQLGPFLNWGTNFIGFFTGVIYAIIGPTLYGGYLVYAFFAFWGSYFFYRAFSSTFPQGNKLLYAILVFFFPSILYWSNGIGKDALIFLCIGLFAYGSAQLTRHQLKSLLPLILGFLGVMWIRPHIALVLVFTLAIAILVRGVGKGATRYFISIVGLLVVGGLFWFLLPQVAAYVGLKEFSSQGMLSLLQQEQGFTFRGGSTFQTVNIFNPLNFPMAAVTILFRPLPWEAHNLQALVQSLEGIILISLVLWQLKNLGRAILSSRSNTYLLFILVYIIAFIFLFTNVQNFGTLARERTMMLPFFFMLIAYVPIRTQSNVKPQEVTI